MDSEKRKTMQITLNPPGQLELAADFVLMHVGEVYHPAPGSPLTYTIEPGAMCSLCNSRPPVWIAHPGSNAAMDTDASPINAPDTCTTCLNALLQDGQIEISQIEPDGF